MSSVFSLSRQLRARKEWQFFGVLLKADRPLAVAWWIGVLLRGVLPTLLAIAIGVLVAAVQRGESLTTPLAVAGILFVVLQISAPLHQAVGSNIGDRTA